MTAADHHRRLLRRTSFPGHDPAEIAALSIGGVSHSYGPRRALVDVSFTVAPASFHGAAWPQRRRQKHAVLSDYAAVRNSGWASSAFSVTTSTLRQAKRYGCSVSVFQPRTLDLDLSVTQNLFYHAALHGIARGEQRSAQPREF